MGSEKEFGHAAFDKAVLRIQQGLVYQSWTVNARIACRDCEDQSSLANSPGVRYRRHKRCTLVLAMQYRLRWLMVLAMVATVWGQVSYACEAMDTPPQPVCCCEDAKARVDGAAHASPKSDCDQHAGPAALPDSCCVVEYQSAFEDVTSSSSSADPPTLWNCALAPLHGPCAGSLASVAPTSPSPDPDWLLAQAATGRSTYLSTLRLRI